MRRYFGKIRFSKEGIAVDALYHELNEIYLGFFPEFIYVLTDQLYQLEKVANMPIYREVSYGVDAAEIQSVVDLIAAEVDCRLQTDRGNPARAGIAHKLA